MHNQSMITMYKHTFELTEEAAASVLSLIELDRCDTRLRPARESGLTDEQALQRFRIACSALDQLSPRLQKTGNANRAAAHRHLRQLQRTARDLASALSRLQDAIGSDDYNRMPPGALAALEAVTTPNTVSLGRPKSFADLVSDPLAWQRWAGPIATTADWAESLSPIIERALETTQSPGRARGSAARVAGGEVLTLLRLLDRSDVDPARRPSRQHLSTWLDLLFQVTGVPPQQSVDVLAKNILADQFPKDKSEWRHPMPPWSHLPRDLLICRIDAEGTATWSGAMAGDSGHQKSSE